MNQLSRIRTWVLLVLTLMLASGCAAMPIDDSKLSVLKRGENGFYYEEIVAVEGQSADEIYGRALAWMAKQYRSANDVIQLQDKDNKRIIGKGISQVPFMLGMISVRHTVHIEARDGRYRLTFDGLMVQPEQSSEWELSLAQMPQLKIVTGTEVNISAAAKGLREAMQVSPQLDGW